MSCLKVAARSFPVLLCVLTGGSFPASARTTFVNPLDLDYRLRPETNVCFREAADPEVILQDDRYYLFASKCGGYYVSDNLADWRLIRTTALPTEEYAPTVEAVNGALHYSARKGSVHRAIDPERGLWTRTEGLMLHTCDSALFRDDDGRLYAYWAEDFQGENPIRGCEIDPVTFRDKSPVRLLMEQGVARYGWEVRGERNEQVGGAVIH